MTSIVATPGCGGPTHQDRNMARIGSARRPSTTSSAAPGVGPGVDPAPRPPPVEEPDPVDSGPAASTGDTAPPTATGDTGGPLPPVNLLVNGDFEGAGGWSHRQGIVGTFSAAPFRKGRAWFVDDDSDQVSWTWSDPVLVKEGAALCLRADTYKFQTTDGGYPRVWVRFFATPAANIYDRVLVDAKGDSIDVETWMDNRYADEEVWVPIEEELQVPVGWIASLRVLLTSNSLPTGRMFFDDLVLVEEPCPKP